VTLLRSVPAGVTPWIVPLVAPVGTVVVISAADTTVNDDEVPLKLTLVVPVRFVPRMIVEDPTFLAVPALSQTDQDPLLT